MTLYIISTPGVFSENPPTFLRALAYEASLGQSSYHHFGREVGRQLEDHLVPYASEHDEWSREVAAFRSLVQRDRGAAIKWLRHHYPSIMQLVPAKRRPSFVNGLVEVFHED